MTPTVAFVFSAVHKLGSNAAVECVSRHDAQ